MCGIAGLYRTDGGAVDPRHLEGMIVSLRHRGPDRFGCVLGEADGPPRAWRPGESTAPAQGGGAVGLAVARLRILDLSEAGDQPMANEDGTCWLAYNGEVYNYRELRMELEARGHRFRSRTDTEVILHAYEEWGPECLAHFNGMWAFALYDARARSLFCARDRMGIKPFYYWWDGRTFAFASEIKALLRLPFVPRRPDLAMVARYAGAHYRFVDGGEDSFFEGIRQLPGAHALTVGPAGFAPRQYWDVDPDRELRFPSPAACAEAYGALLADAVRLRLRSDVPVATTLSGGLDSTAITCLAARQAPEPIRTFSACFEERPFDERPEIDLVVAATGARPAFVHPAAGDLVPDLEPMLAAYDEPVPTVTWLAHWQVMRAVHGEGLRVLLNGHGADELLAGYYYHFLYRFADLLEGGEDEALGRELAAWQARHGRSPEEFAAFRRDQVPRLARGALHEILDDLAAYRSCLVPDLAVAVRAPERPRRFKGHLKEKRYRELRWETVPATLRPEDRNSMAFSIETRLPFLDYRLVEFCFAAPDEWLIRDGLTKVLHREAMRGILPEPIRLREEKVGFNAPAHRWFRAGARGEVEAILRSPGFAGRGVFNVPEVLRVFEEHCAGGANHAMALWQWVNVELWFRRAFDGPCGT